jgi:ankyrin repeat protein
LYVEVEEGEDNDEDEDDDNEEDQGDDSSSDDNDSTAAAHAAALGQSPQLAQQKASQAPTLNDPSGEAQGIDIPKSDEHVDASADEKVDLAQGTSKGDADRTSVIDNQREERRGKVSPTAMDVDSKPEDSASNVETSPTETKEEIVTKNTNGEHQGGDTGNQSPRAKKLQLDRSIHLNERDDDENTALHVAIHARKLEHVKVLLEAGASCRLKCDGSWPIHTLLTNALLSYGSTGLILRPRTMHFTRLSS